MSKIVDRVRGVKIGDYIEVKHNNDDKLRYGKVFFIHPERRYCLAKITGRYNKRYNECFTNEEFVILSAGEADIKIKEKFGDYANLDFENDDIDLSLDSYI